MWNTGNNKRNRNDFESSGSALNNSTVGSKEQKTDTLEVTSSIESLHSDASIKADASAIGITDAHQLYFSKLAKEHHLILLWRPVNSNAAGKLANNYVGKRLNLKSKSSEFGPIAGDIPSNPRLGKAIFFEEEKLKNLDAVNRSLVAYSVEESDSAIRDKIASLGTEREKQDAIAKLNDAYRVTEMDKYIGENLIYYATEADGSILTLELNNSSEPSKTPRFFIQISENQYQEYNYEQSDFSKPVILAEENLSFQPVKILAYKRFRYNETNSCIIEDKPITADYDELACCPRNDYPFYNNTQVRTQITNSLYKELSTPGGLTEEKKIEIIAQLMIEHDNAKYAEEQALVDRLSMGYMTDHEYALKTVENLDTDGATNHGPEVYNFYYAEKFSVKPEDVYFAHLPDGRTEQFKNDSNSTAEQKICDFINERRKDGYPIPVNPCWGWNITEAGLLTTENSTERKEKWRQTMEELQKLEHEVNEIDSDLKSAFKQFSIPLTSEMQVLVSEFAEKNFSRTEEEVLNEYPENQPEFLQQMIKAGVLESVTGLIELNEKMKKNLSYQRTLIKLQLQIERIRLGADLTYSACSLEGDAHHTYDDNELILNRKVSSYIKKHVHDIKQARITLLKDLQIRPLFELTDMDFRTSLVLDFIDGSVHSKVRELVTVKQNSLLNQSPPSNFRT